MAHIVQQAGDGTLYGTCANSVVHMLCLLEVVTEKLRSLILQLFFLDMVTRTVINENMMVRSGGSGCKMVRGA